MASHDSYCYLVGGICVRRSVQCSVWSYGRVPWPQRLRTFARQLPRVSLAETTPPNATGPWSTTGGSFIPTVAWSVCPCHWVSLTQEFPRYIFHDPSPPSGIGRHWGLQQGLGPQRSGSGWVPQRCDQAHMCCPAGFITQWWTTASASSPSGSWGSGGLSTYVPQFTNHKSHKEEFHPPLVISGNLRYKHVVPRQAARADTKNIYYR